MDFFLLIIGLSLIDWPLSSLTSCQWHCEVNYQGQISYKKWTIGNKCFVRELGDHTGLMHKKLKNKFMRLLWKSTFRIWLLSVICPPKSLSQTWCTNISEKLTPHMLNFPAWDWLKVTKTIVTKNLMTPSIELEMSLLLF